MTQTKTLAPLEIKAIDEKQRTFTGLASTWDLDLGGDVIHKGAFRKSLREWRAAGKPMPLIDQHNYGSIRSVVGKMVDAKETDDGLEAEFEIIDGPDGDEVLRRVKGGYVDGLSIGYEPKSWDYEEGPDGGSVRHLKEVKLHEVSVVIWPMNPGATIDAAMVKGLVSRLGDETKAELRALLNDSRKSSEPATGEIEDDEAPDIGALDRLRLRRMGHTTTR